MDVNYFYNTVSKLWEIHWSCKKTGNVLDITDKNTFSPKEDK